MAIGVLINNKYLPILLAKAVHLRGVESRAEVDHARGGVVVFAVVAEAGTLLAKLLAKRAVALAGHRREVFAAVVQLHGHAAAPVVEVLCTGVAGNSGDTLQAVDEGSLLPVLRALNHHAVTVEYIIGERGCHVFACRNRRQQTLRIVSVALAVAVLAGECRQEISRVIGIAPRTGGVLALDEVAVGVVAVCRCLAALDALDKLVGGVVAHGGLDAVLRLREHVARRVIGVALALPVAAREVYKLPQRVIDIAACQGRAVLAAALARHTPGEVIGVFQCQLIRPVLVWLTRFPTSS